VEPGSECGRVQCSVAACCRFSLEGAFIPCVPSWVPVFCGRVAAALWCRCVCVLFASWFNEDYEGPILGVGKAESCQFEAAVPLPPPFFCFLPFFPALQDHRMFRVGRDLCGSPSPTPLPKQGDPEQAAQDLVQAGLEYLQRRRLHNLPGQPVPVLCHPQSEEVLYSPSLPRLCPGQECTNLL